MELAGSGYLYALATVSVTFVGFSALLIVFRQSMGGALTQYDSYFTLTFIQIGFIVTAGALLPPVLAFYGSPADVVWRVSAGVIAVPLVWFDVTLPSKRRAATGQPTPRFIKLSIAVHLIAASALVLSAAGALPDREAAAYVSAITTVLVTAGTAYLTALGLTLPDMTSRPK